MQIQDDIRVRNKIAARIYQQDNKRQVPGKCQLMMIRGRNEGHFCNNEPYLTYDFCENCIRSTCMFNVSISKRDENGNMVGVNDIITINDHTRSWAVVAYDHYFLEPLSNFIVFAQNNQIYVVGKLDNQNMSEKDVAYANELGFKI